MQNCDPSILTAKKQIAHRRTENKKSADCKSVFTFGPSSLAISFRTMSLSRQEIRELVRTELRTVVKEESEKTSIRNIVREEIEKASIRSNNSLGSPPHVHESCRPAHGDRPPAELPQGVREGLRFCVP